VFFKVFQFLFAGFPAGYFDYDKLIFNI